MPTGFFNYNAIATQKRLAAYSSNRSAYATVSGASFSGQFQPLDPKMSINMGLAGQGYSFVCAGAADIKANDILIIDAVEYHVSGIQRFQQASIDILKCALVLSVKTT